MALILTLCLPLKHNDTRRLLGGFSRLVVETEMVELIIEGFIFNAPQKM